MNFMITWGLREITTYYIKLFGKKTQFHNYNVLFSVRVVTFNGIFITGYLENHRGIQVLFVAHDLTDWMRWCIMLSINDYESIYYGKLNTQIRHGIIHDIRQNETFKYIQQLYIHHTKSNHQKNPTHQSHQMIFKPILQPLGIQRHQRQRLMQKHCTHVALDEILPEAWR